MTKATVTTIVALMMIQTLTAAPFKRGVGCWRSVRAQAQATARILNRQEADSPKQTPYKGQKRGLVILAEFTDAKFKSGHDRQKYNDILNTPGYTTQEGFRGSVADYFRDQSDGQFELVFDVVGPYPTKRSYKYYGENDAAGQDKRPEEMVIEMCRAADDEVNFNDYDWDGDGEVDEVFVVYAGKGEADTEKEDCIWPHMWALDEAGKRLVLDGCKINTYACANEIDASSKINGIGTFCHEFSHCLGLPDFYDITYSGEFGMGDFDLMAGGNYNGNGFCPPCFTAYEKMVCGWQQPIVLGAEDMTIDSLKPMSQNGDFYIIYNDGHPDEYYLIENRQKTGWDESYPARGLLITHVDYDEEVWLNNIPNSILTQEEAEEMELTVGNTHQRMTLFHADNDDDSKYYSQISGYYRKTTLSTDLYPYLKHDSLTTTSKPAATLFNDNALGTKLMQGAILGISHNSDGTMNFTYRAPKPQEADAIRHVNATRKPSGMIYTLDGRTAGTDLQSLRHGIYVVDGKKIVR